MQTSLWQELKKNPLVLAISVLAHALGFAALALGSFTHVYMPEPAPPADTIEAVAIDSTQVEAEAERLKQLEEAQRRQREEEIQQAELARKQEEQRLAQVEEQRKKQEEELKQQQQREEQRLAELRRQQHLEQQQAEQLKEKQRKEQERLAKLEEQKKQEEARLEKLKQEREAAAKQREEEQKRLAALEEKRKAEEAAQQKAREEAERKQREEAQRKAREDAERKEREAAQRQSQEYIARIQALRSQYIKQIERKVEQNWLRPPTTKRGFHCEVMVTQTPLGDVIDVQMLKCDGEEAFQKSVERAVLKASPLPPPPDPAVFERKIQFTFRPIS